MMDSGDSEELFVSEVDWTVNTPIFIFLRAIAAGGKLMKHIEEVKERSVVV